MGICTSLTVVRGEPQKHEQKPQDNQRMSSRRVSSNQHADGVDPASPLETSGGYRQSPYEKQRKIYTQRKSHASRQSDDRHGELAAPLNGHHRAGAYRESSSGATSSEKVFLAPLTSDYLRAHTAKMARQPRKTIKHYIMEAAHEANDSSFSQITINFSEAGQHDFHPLGLRVKNDGGISQVINRSPERVRRPHKPRSQSSRSPITDHRDASRSNTGTRISKEQGGDCAALTPNRGSHLQPGTPEERNISMSLQVHPEHTLSRSENPLASREPSIAVATVGAGSIARHSLPASQHEFSKERSKRCSDSRGEGDLFVHRISNSSEEVLKNVRITVETPLHDAQPVLALHEENPRLSQLDQRAPVTYAPLDAVRANGDSSSGVKLSSNIVRV